MFINSLKLWKKKINAKAQCYVARTSQFLVMAKRKSLKIICVNLWLIFLKNFRIAFVSVHSQKIINEQI
jgi:hypothetical protein